MLSQSASARCFRGWKNKPRAQPEVPQHLARGAENRDPSNESGGGVPERMKAWRGGAEEVTIRLLCLFLLPPIPLPLLVEGYLQSLPAGVSRGVTGMGKIGSGGRGSEASRLSSRVRSCPSRKPRRLPHPPLPCVSPSARPL